MRVILLGKKPASCRCLEYLLARGVEVVAVVAPPRDKPAPWRERLADAALAAGLPVVTSRAVYATLGGKDRGLDLREIDAVFSFLFWERIRNPLIRLGKRGCINFHAAPLPEFRGLGAFNVAICEKVTSWGVTAHFIDDEQFDTGDLISVKRFTIDPDQETAFSLEQRSLRALVELFQEVVDLLMAGDALPREVQGQGRYITREEYTNLRVVTPTMAPEEIERRIRAFWYPPYPSATVQISGREYSLVSDDLMRQLGEQCHGDRRY